MTGIDFEAVKAHVMNRLQKELPPGLYYHGIHHTRDDVLPAVERLATLAAISEADWLLLRTAALYHDVGYIDRRYGHEIRSSEIARQELPSFGYSQVQSERVASLILATHFPQSPNLDDPLALLLCDADMDSLGREDFFITSERLRYELRLNGLAFSLKEWAESQLKLLEGHHYFTHVARTLRDEGKASNLQELRQLLGVLA